VGRGTEARKSICLTGEGIRKLAWEKNAVHKPSPTHSRSEFFCSQNANDRQLAGERAQLCAITWRAVRCFQQKCALSGDQPLTHLLIPESSLSGTQRKAEQLAAAANEQPFDLLRKIVGNPHGRPDRLREQLTASGSFQCSAIRGHP
jgi:hypothetical protein